MKKRILLPTTGILILISIILVAVIGTFGRQQHTSDSSILSSSESAATDIVEIKEGMQNPTEGETKSENSTGVETTEEYFTDDSSEIQSESSSGMELTEGDLVEDDEIIDTIESDDSSSQSVETKSDSSDDGSMSSDDNSSSSTDSDSNGNNLELPLLPIG